MSISGWCMMQGPQPQGMSPAQRMCDAKAILSVREWFWGAGTPLNTPQRVQSSEGMEGASAPCSVPPNDSVAPVGCHC